MHPQDPWASPIGSRPTARQPPPASVATADAVPDVVRRGEADFEGDLRRALRVWREQPALPLLTTAFAIVTALAASEFVGPAVTGLAGVLGLVFLGYVGAERLWYLRAFTGRQLGPGAAVHASFGYWGRFVRLGLLLLLVSIPLYAPVTAVLLDVGQEARASGGEPDLPLWAALYVGLVSLVIDFALTFVTPALVFNTRRARSAIRIGFRLLRRSWPHALTYVLFPPFAVLLLTRFSSGEVGWGGVALIVGSSLVNLAAKGATAAYYLRVMPIDRPDGDTDLYLD